MHNELSREKREGWEETVDDKEDGSEWVDANVEVCNTLEKLEATGGKEGVVSGEENLNRASGPQEHLVERVSEVDGSSATESISLCDAVYGPPPTVVHSVTGDHVSVMIRRSSHCPPTRSYPRTCT